jgi:hypothetical protein
MQKHKLKAKANWSLSQIEQNCPGAKTKCTMTFCSTFSSLFSIGNNKIKNGYSLALSLH